MKKILIINGHPDPESLCTSFAKTYFEAATSFHYKTDLINLGEIVFNPNLQHGYRKRTNLEPDLLDAIEKLKSADHIVFTYPVWWGTFPAILKGFIDRVFLPGITYQPSQGIKWEKLLKGKTARLIVTMDAPIWYNRFFYKQPAINAMKKATLKYCGVGKVKVTQFSPIKTSTEEQRNAWLKKVEKLGKKGL